MVLSRGRVHDRAVLDALEAAPSQPFEGDVWRVTRTGRDPLRGSGASGRWNAASEFEVLYTSLERDGALAETGYRLSLEPVWPSLLQHEVHRLEVQTQRTLRLANLASLTPLGIDVSRYESFDYSVSQAIAAAAHFLDFDGLIVPSSRFDCLNLVLFLERLSPDGRVEVRDTESIDWTAWRKSRVPRKTRPVD
jgi:hypothetical protein